MWDSTSFHSSHSRFTDDDCDEDPQRYSNYTSLWNACKQSNVSRAQILAAECGYDINKVSTTRGNRTERGLAIIHYLASRGYNEMIQTLYDSGFLDVDRESKKQDRALHVAAKNGHMNTVELLLKLGADINACNKKKNTALHMSAMNGCIKCVNVLINNNADVNAINSTGDSALHWAARRGECDIMKDLLSKSADVNLSNSTNETALICAIKRNCTTCVGLLLNHKSDANLEDNKGNLSLNLAVQNDNMDIIEKLYDHDLIDVNKINTSGYAALHVALDEKNYDVAKWLIEHDRTDINLMNVDHDTPLHLVVKNSRVDLIKALLKRADPGIHNALGLMPAHNALNQCSEEMTRLFMDHMDVQAEKENAKLSPLHGSLWRKFLGYRSTEGEKPVTPFRTMIRQMPHVAENVMDRCIGQDKEMNFSLIYDYVDDTYSQWDNRAYSEDYSVLKYNHPMTMFDRYKRKHLLHHPLTRFLLKKKWKITFILYILFLLFYLFYVCFLSVYMLTSEPPYNHHNNTNTTCPVETLNLFHCVLRYVVYILASMGVVFEFIQLVLTRKIYLQFHNTLDWFSYIGGVCICLPIGHCDMRTLWQWKLGCTVVFLSWMNLLFYLRRLPKLGLYVVMISMMLKTFAQICIIIVMFIIGFAVPLYLLMQNQFPLHTPLYAMLKSWIMMFGELDFMALLILFRQSESSLLVNQFEIFVLFWFVAFLILIPLILMNLLVALAVSDVDKLEKSSTYQMLAMQIDLSLDLELSLPSWIIRKWLKDKDVFDDNAISSSASDQNTLYSRIKRHFEGPLYLPLIKKEALQVIKKRNKFMKTAEDTKTVKMEKRIKAMEKTIKEMHEILKQKLLNE